MRALVAKLCDGARMAIFGDFLHYGERAPENVYMVHQTRRRSNIVQSTVGFR